MKTFKLHFLFGLFIGIVFLFSSKSYSQSIADLRINEILVINDSNYVDDFGSRSSWIEIFNSAYNYVNIAGCYLTNDLKNPKKYQIPKGDPVTKISPRGYLVFWADNKPSHGTLHLNFNLKETNFLALFNSDGKTLIDSISFSQQKSDISYGRIENGGSVFGFLDKTTPNSSNVTVSKATSAEKFQKLDPWGVGMAIIAMSVVFLSLLLLYLSFKNLGNLYIRSQNKKEKKHLKEDDGSIQKIIDSEAVPGEHYAAIAMALYLYSSELHDQENTILTINKVSRNYSPWSSKIYGLRNFPNR